MTRPTVEYLDADRLNPVPLTDYGIPLGLRGSVLSIDPQTDALTAIVKGAELWVHPDSGFWSSDMEILILEGSLQIGSQTVPWSSYLTLRAGETYGSMSSPEGVTLLLMSSGPLVFTPKGGSVSAAAIDISRTPWMAPPGFEGRDLDATVPGLRIKWLKMPSQGSPGYTMLAYQVGGWGDPRLESHACWEELLLLNGDYLMGVNGSVSAGCYIWRNGEIPHGPQATRSGSVWFCRGDRMIDFELQNSTWADRQMATYLAQTHKGAVPAPWGDWMSEHIST